MPKIYVIVGPDFTGKHETLMPLSNKFQVIDEGAVIRGQQLESVPKNEMFRYGLISVMARAHLISQYDILCLCDNLSIEALCLWRKMATEHQAECIIVLMDADQESAMARVTQMKLPEDREKQLVHSLANQFKRYDDIHNILTNKLNTIGRDLSDQVISEEEFLKSQEG
jgi:ABC-type branched-subunit amino acid transport system ATPase component